LTLSFPTLQDPIKIAEQHWAGGTRPLVSIVCLAYNHAKYIREAVEGFLMQETTFPVEILIHDDASTDGTREIIQEYEKKIPSLIIPIFQDENQFSRGIDPFYSFLIPNSQGKYIAVCEGDDYWVDSLKLQKQVNLFEQYPDTVICGARAKTWNEQKEEFTGINPAEDKNIACLTPREFFYLADWVKNCTRMIPRSLISQVPKEYMMDYRHAHYIMAKNPQGTFRCLEEITAVYREHAGGVFSGASSFQVQEEYFESTKLIARVYEDERAIIMRENAVQTATGLMAVRALPLSRRIYYFAQSIILTLGNFSFLGIKRMFGRWLVSASPDQHPIIKTFRQRIYRLVKKVKE